MLQETSEFNCFSWPYIKIDTFSYATINFRIYLHIVLLLMRANLFFMNLFANCFVNIFSSPYQNCSGSLNSVLRRCDNKVYFARQASSSFGYFMRQASLEEVLSLFLLMKYSTLLLNTVRILVTVGSRLNGPDFKFIYCNI
jgi:hypothetical protein